MCPFQISFHITLRHKAMWDGLQVFDYPGTIYATIVSQSCPLFETKIGAAAGRVETSHYCLLSSMGGYCVWQIDNIIKLSILLWKTWCHLNSLQSTRPEDRSSVVMLLLTAHNGLDPVATLTNKNIAVHSSHTVSRRTCSVDSWLWF